jgi:hypothetical protein
MELVMIDKRFIQTILYEARLKPFKVDTYLLRSEGSSPHARRNWEELAALGAYYMTSRASITKLALYLDQQYQDEIKFFSNSASLEASRTLHI